MILAAVRALILSVTRREQDALEPLPACPRKRVIVSGSFAAVSLKMSEFCLLR